MVIIENKPPKAEKSANSKKVSIKLKKKKSFRKKSLKFWKKSINFLSFGFLYPRKRRNKKSAKIAALVIPEVKLCMLCHEKEDCLKRKCCNAIYCNHCYTKNKKCPNCDEPTQQEKLTGNLKFSLLFLIF